MGILRQNAHCLLYCLRSMIGSSGIHDFQEIASIDFVIANLNLGLSEPESHDHIKSLVYLSLASSFTTLNFFMHSINQTLTKSHGLFNAGAKFIEADDLQNLVQNQMKSDNFKNQKIESS